MGTKAAKQPKKKKILLVIRSQFLSSSILDSIPENCMQRKSGSELGYRKEGFML